MLGAECWRDGGRGSRATEHKHPEKNDFRELSAISANLLF